MTGFRLSCCRYIVLSCLDSYAFFSRKSLTRFFLFGEGSCGLEQVEDCLNGIVRFVQSGLQWAGGTARVGAVVKEAVGQRATETMVKEHEAEGDFLAFGGQAVGVAVVDAFDEGVALEFAQVVAQLGDAVAVGDEVEGREDGLVQLGGLAAAARLSRRCSMKYSAASG